MRIETKKQIRSLRIRLLLPAIGIMLVSLLIQLILFSRVNRATDSLQGAYAANIRLNEVGTVLNAMEENVHQYLNVRSIDSLNAYKEGETEFLAILDEIDETIEDHPARILELNIKMLGYSYVRLVNQAILQKQDHAVLDYQSSYAEIQAVYGYLSSTIESLDVFRFRSNSENYEILYQNLRFLERLMTGMQVSLIIGLMGILFAIIQDYISKIRDSMEKEMELREQEFSMEKLLLDAQLKYLQAQINPHFLFNTLNAGQQLAMMEGADRTYNYMEHTAQFFRYRLKKSGERSTLREEMELIDNYLYIMNVRYSGEIHLVKEIDETALSESFPGMMLQPIVENALLHGLASVDWDKEIRIQISKSGQETKICIRDNGIGMSEELLRQLNTGSYPSCPDDTQAGNSVGLRNVRERLRLFFDREDVLQFESDGENQGTSVCIRF